MRRLLQSGLGLLAGLPVISHALNSRPALHDQWPIQQDGTGLVHRVAIVGAGPAGSSAAYHLARFAADDGVPLNITVFDSNSRVGGRTTTVNALDDPRYPVELGASIFVNINHILYNATQDFDLPVNHRIYESTGAEYDLGIWDGETFVFRTVNEDGSGWRGTLMGWWDIAKLFWRYGVNSPIRLRNLQRDVIRKFLNMYDAQFPFADLTRVAEDLDLLRVTGQSGAALLEEAGVGERFAREIVQASSRVNYAQNLANFHGLETMVCMSTDGAMSIEGGNWQIFDGMVRRSGATLRLDTTVTGIEATQDGVSYVSFESAVAERGTDPSGTAVADRSTTSSVTIQREGFDTVILAHPHNPSQLSLSPQPSRPRDTPAYVSLHVTLFTTPDRPSPLFFNLPLDKQSSVPDTILTTLPADLDPTRLGRGADAVGPTTIWSLSTLRVLNPSRDSFDSLDPLAAEGGHIPASSLELNQTQYLYKIFSPAPLSAEYLSALFGWTEQGEQRKEADSSSSSSPLSTLPKHLLTWHHEKMWQSYPYLPPRTSFEPFDVYLGKEEDGREQTRAGRLWSTAPMEVFISTMETSALSGMNVARLALDHLRRE